MGGIKDSLLGLATQRVLAANPNYRYISEVLSSYSHVPGAAFNKLKSGFGNRNDLSSQNDMNDSMAMSQDLSNAAATRGPGRPLGSKNKPKVVSDPVQTTGISSDELRSVANILNSIKNTTEHIANNIGNEGVEAQLGNLSSKFDNLQTNSQRSNENIRQLNEKLAVSNNNDNKQQASLEEQLGYVISNLKRSNSSINELNKLISTLTSDINNNAKKELETLIENRTSSKATISTALKPISNNLVRITDVLERIATATEEQLKLQKFTYGLSENSAIKSSTIKKAASSIDPTNSRAISKEKWFAEMKEAQDKSNKLSKAMGLDISKIKESSKKNIDLQMEEEKESILYKIYKTVREGSGSIFSSTVKGVGKGVANLGKAYWKHVLRPTIEDKVAYVKSAAASKKEANKSKLLEEYSNLIKEGRIEEAKKLEKRITKSGIGDTLLGLIGGGSGITESKVFLNRLENRNTVATFDNEVRDTIVKGIPLLLSEIIKAINGKEAFWSYEMDRLSSSSDYEAAKTIASKHAVLDTQKKLKSGAFLTSKNKMDTLKKLYAAQDEEKLAELIAKTHTGKANVYKKSLLEIENKYSKDAVKNRGDIFNLVAENQGAQFSRHAADLYKKVKDFTIGAAKTLTGRDYADLKLSNVDELISNKTNINLQNILNRSGLNGDQIIDFINASDGNPDTRRGSKSLFSKMNESFTAGDSAIVHAINLSKEVLVDILHSLGGKGKAKAKDNINTAEKFVNNSSIASSDFFLAKMNEIKAKKQYKMETENNNYLKNISKHMIHMDKENTKYHRWQKSKSILSFLTGGLGTVLRGALSIISGPLNMMGALLFGPLWSPLKTVSKGVGKSLFWIVEKVWDGIKIVSKSIKLIPAAITKMTSIFEVVSKSIKLIPAAIGKLLSLFAGGKVLQNFKDLFKIGDSTADIVTDSIPDIGNAPDVDNKSNLEANKKGPNNPLNKGEVKGGIKGGAKGGAKKLIKGGAKALAKGGVRAAAGTLAASGAGAPLALLLNTLLSLEGAYSSATDVDKIREQTGREDVSFIDRVKHGLGGFLSDFITFGFIDPSTIVNSGEKIWNYLTLNGWNTNKELEEAKKNKDEGGFGEKFVNLVKLNGWKTNKELEEARRQSGAEYKAMPFKSIVEQKNDIIKAYPNLKNSIDDLSTYNALREQGIIDPNIPFYIWSDRMFKDLSKKNGYSYNEDSKITTASSVSLTESLGKQKTFIDRYKENKSYMNVNDNSGNVYAVDNTVPLKTSVDNVVTNVQASIDPQNLSEMTSLLANIANNTSVTNQLMSEMNDLKSKVSNIVNNTTNVINQNKEIRDMVGKPNPDYIQKPAKTMQISSNTLAASMN